MTLYLLDANVIIQAHEDYYPVDRIPQFWSWLLDMAAMNVIKMPRVIFNEVTPSVGPLADWIKQSHVKDAMILDEPVDGTVSTLGVVRPRSPLAGVDRWLDEISVRSRSRACRCRERSESGAEDRRRVVTSASTAICPSDGSPGNWPSPR